MVATDALLSRHMILQYAMHMVGEAVPENTEPFEVDFEAVFPTESLTLPIHRFAEEVLREVVDAALKHRRPLTRPAPFEPPPPSRGDMENTGAWEERAIFGRMRRQYDVSRDANRIRIEIRVCGASA